MKSLYHGIPILLVVFVVGLTCMGQAARAQAAAPSGEAQALVKQGQKLNNEGKQDEALKLYQQALEKSPNSYEAHLESGVALDLKGDYAAAREHLKKAIDVAPADQKNRALRVMAFSYAFEGNSAEAEKYEKQVFDALLAKPDFEAAAGVANELARIKLESGDIDGAAKWYKTGYDTAMRKTDMKDADKNLWAFRWAHAQARIAARRGQTRRSPETGCRGESGARQGKQSRPGAVLSVSHRICGVLWRRLQDGDHRSGESESGRPVHPGAARPVL